LKSAFSFLPRGFASLLDYISPAAFDVIDWKAALKKAGKISKELVFESNVERVKAQIAEHLPPGLKFADKELFKEVSDNQFTRNSKKELGQNILVLYFRQIFLGPDVFLDFRKERFSRFEAESGEQTLYWKPNGLWIEFNSEFLEGLRLLYKGFYEQNETALDRGLFILGLYSETMTHQAKSELKGLLESHFGQGRTAPMKFEVAHFMTSFDNLFIFLKNNKLKLSEDFLFLGIYILTLYLHLEFLGDPFDVVAAYNHVKVGS
jgi:hypothetical protein